MNESPLTPYEFGFLMMYRDNNFPPGTIPHQETEYKTLVEKAIIIDATGQLTADGQLICQFSDLSPELIETLYHVSTAGEKGMRVFVQTEQTDTPFKTPCDVLAEMGWLERTPQTSFNLFTLTRPAQLVLPIVQMLMETINHINKIMSQGRPDLVMVTIKVTHKGIVIFQDELPGFRQGGVVSIAQPISLPKGISKDEIEIEILEVKTLQSPPQPDPQFWVAEEEKSEYLN